MHQLAWTSFSITFPWEAMGSPWTRRLSTHGLWAGLAGVSYKEPSANLTVHETQKPPWSTGPPQGQREWRASQIVGYIWACVQREENSNVSCTASVQLPERPSSPPWAVECTEQCGTELQLAGKRPPALYHRRDTGAGCQILSSREWGLRGSQETLGGEG